MNSDSVRCPQCGREIDEQQPTASGLVLCPQCAHSVVLSSERPQHTSRHYARDRAVEAFGQERFRLSGTLGEGGFGTVYRAFDLSLQRYVAIKRPKKDDQQFDAAQFILEARAASILRHPNIVTIYDVGFAGASPYIVSECIEGVSLRQWLDSPHATHANIAKVVAKLCRALAYAHALGVVHRDVKPSNVIIDDSGEPHLLDFGLSSSRATGDAITFRAATPTGTPAYMAPEQIRGELAAIGRATDVYSVGVVLYQLLARRLPFVGSPSRIFELALDSEPIKPRSIDPRIPTALEAIALKGMRKSIADRYSSMDALADDLDRFVAGQVVRALGRHDKRSFMMTARRRMVGGLAIAAGFGLLTAAGFGVYDWASEDPRVWIQLDGQDASDTLTWVPFDEVDGGRKPQFAVRAAGDSWLRLNPGLYAVRAESGGRSIEVFRTVPSPGQTLFFFGDGGSDDGSRIPPLRWQRWDAEADSETAFRLPKIDYVSPSPLERMGAFQEGWIEYPSPPRGVSPYTGRHRVEAFTLDESEATVSEVARAFGSPIFNAGRPLSDTAVLPFPVAVEYAERRGASLMSVWEWLYATTNGGRTLYPWGDEFPEGFTWSQLGSIDKTLPPTTIRGLFSGIAEWTETPVTLPEASNYRKPGNSEAITRSRLVVGFPSTGFVRDYTLDHQHIYRFLPRPVIDPSKPIGVRCVRRG